MTHDKEAVKAMAFAIGDKLGERRQIHALLFRRRSQPFLRRPCRFIQVLCACGPEVNGGQQSA